MERVRPENLERLRALGRLAGSNPAEAARQLALIEFALEPEAYPYLLPLALDQDVRPATAAAEAIARLSAKVPPHRLPGLDEELRWWPGYLRELDAGPWRDIGPDDLVRFERFGPGGQGLLRAASAHWNGFVRQAAVERLAREADGAELPFLLVRLNDWVWQVRSAAEGRWRTG